MSSPHKCPICEGKGEVTRKLAQVGSVVVCQKPLLFRCHGCQGQGLLWDPAPLITLPTVQPIDPNITPYWTTNSNDCPGIVNPNNDQINNLKNGGHGGSIECRADGSIVLNIDPGECDGES